MGTVRHVVTPPLLLCAQIGLFGDPDSGSRYSEERILRSDQIAVLGKDRARCVLFFMRCFDLFDHVQVNLYAGRLPEHVNLENQPCYALYV